MKTLLTTTLLLLGMFLFNDIQAQTSSKDLDKKTKAELKEYLKNPSNYRLMMKNQKDQIEAYELQLNEIQEDYYKADYLRITYYDSILVLQDSLSNCKSRKNPTDTIDQLGSLLAESNSSSTFKTSGTDYRVQIGAYRMFDFTSLLKFNQPIGFDKNNGIIYYYIGSWNDPIEANELAKALIKLRIEGAFVTKYIDGERVPYDFLTEGNTASNY